MGRWLYVEDGLVPGYLSVEGDEVVETCEGSPPRDAVKGIVLPAFVNAHTHIGDAVAYPSPKGTVEEIVAPPESYKHRVLRTTSIHAKVEAMRIAIDAMVLSGTCAFIDFREEGIEGIRQLREAAGESGPTSVVLGRPAGRDLLGEELDSVLAECDGLGMSALRDWPPDHLSRASSKAHSVGKSFAIHASETVREEIDDVLALEPDFLVHMTHATDEDLARCAEAGVPIVVCPRANAFFGQRPDISRMLQVGVTVALGTDNAMISVPNLLEELQAAYALGVSRDGITPDRAVQLATFGGRKVLNATGKITRNGTPWNDLAVIAVGDEDPLRDVVMTARPRDILALVRNGKVRRSRNWSMR